MIAINKISYQIGNKVLFDDASLYIGEKDKIGLIGLNGTGKSTLLKMIIGEIQPQSGQISKSNQTTIGYLNQDLLSLATEQSILDVALQAFSETLNYKNQIDEIIQDIEKNYTEEKVVKLTQLQEKFELQDGYKIQSKTEEVLEGIGFKTSELSKPLQTFSGGWRMRVVLAKMLLENPNLLLLDEPTNHLDLPAIQWLENYLKSYEGACMVVSHDRKFLNSVVNKTVEVNAQNLHVYAGNYDFFLSEKELRNELQQNAFANQQQKIKQSENFINRFRSKSTKARQVQSKIKMLEKMEKVEAVQNEDIKINFKFSFHKKSGRHVKISEHLSKNFGNHILLKNTSLHIERGDKIALIGANGTGKSTLLRIIAETEPFEGKMETGHNVISSFYAQHQLEALQLSNEILEELKQIGTDKTEQELRNVLGCFLFSDDDVFKKIKVLSGGEKSRVALAKTLISEANFLLLDEPTHHLDILSIEILAQALIQYEGTFVLVSHDRHFINQVVNKIWYIEDNELKVYPGSYEEYEWWVRNHSEKMIQKKNTTQEPKNKPKIQKEKKQKEKENSENERKKLEQKIENVEEELKELENQLSNFTQFENQADFHKKSDQFNEKKRLLDKMMEEWKNL